MSLASEMAVISDGMASVDDYVSKTFEKAKRLGVNLYPYKFPINLIFPVFRAVSWIKIR